MSGGMDLTRKRPYLWKVDPIIHPDSRALCDDTFALKLPCCIFRPIANCFILTSSDN